jgi:hypothetical protein
VHAKVVQRNKVFLTGSVDDLDGNGFPILKFDVCFIMSFESRSITNKEAGFWDSAIAKDDETLDRNGERTGAGKWNSSSLLFLRDPN